MVKTRKELEDAFTAFRALVAEGHKRITLEWTENGPIVCCTSMKAVEASEVDLIVTEEGTKMKWVPKGNTSGTAPVPIVTEHPRRMKLALNRGKRRPGVV